MSAVQKVWSSYVYATILLPHGPAAASPFQTTLVRFQHSAAPFTVKETVLGSLAGDPHMLRRSSAAKMGLPCDAMALFFIVN
jgi:hypothetical protein